jgi:disulfide bond formation protein DsbB
MLSLTTPQQTARFLAAGLFIVIAAAWIFQVAGYEPCELCYMQRWAYYVGVPMAALLAYFNPPWIKTGLIVLALILVANAIFGAYHSGVEWGFWKGPSTCTGTALGDELLPDLSQPGVMCDQPAIRILGLSLAGWNALICAGLAALAFRGQAKQPV